MIEYNKLVRDKIPDIIRSTGRDCDVRIASDEEFKELAIAKIREELNEFEASRSVEELADLYEAFEALRQANGISQEELDLARKEKGEAKGRFEKKLVLISVNDQSRVLDMDDKRSVTELDKSLVSIKRKDHTHIFANCPISKTGFSISSTIDMPASEEYPCCAACQYNNQCGGCAYARKKAGIPDDAELIGFKTDDAKRPIYADFMINGKQYSSKLEPGRDMGMSILAFWQQYKPDVAVFLNLRSGSYARITKDPKAQLDKYKRCYGKISSDGWVYSQESLEIYGVNQRCWVCTWYKKDGKAENGPFGYTSPI